MIKVPEYVSDKPHYHYSSIVEDLVERMLSSDVKLIALDTETYYDDDLARSGAITKWIKGSKNNRPFGVSMFFEINGKREGWWIDTDIEELAPIFEDESIAKILHNSKYDINMLANLGLRVRGKIWDTMAMMHLIDEEMLCRTPSGKMKKSKALKDLAFHFLNGDAHVLENLVSKVRANIAQELEIPKSEVNYKQANDAASNIMKDYAIADTEFTYDLFPIFLQDLTSQSLLATYDLEMEAMFAVINMERRGILIDTDKLLSDKAALQHVINQITIDIDKLVKTPFNVNSSDELAGVFAELGVASWEWITESGDYKVDEETLKTIMRLYLESPVADLCTLVLEHRTAHKIMSTYIDGIYEYIQYDGKVHADFWLFPNDDSKGGTVTGRFSCSNPNLQNITKEPVEIRGLTLNIRSYFKAQEGYVLVFQDAKQQEYRLLAHYANDSNFMEMIHKGWDVHIGTASMMFNAPYEEVTKAQRSKAKTLNFA